GQGRAISPRCASFSARKSLILPYSLNQALCSGSVRSNEVLQVMDDLRIAKVDFLTIGQYLRPTPMHHPVISFVTPGEFKAYETIAYSKGFLMVSASPLTRSSYHAGENFRRIRAATVDVATFARSAGISRGKI